MKFQFNIYAFIFGIISGFIVYFVFSEPKEIYVKYPNPFNSNKTVYTNDDGECYKVKLEEIKCNGDEKIQSFISK